MIKSEKIQIKELVEKRQEFWKIYQDSYDVESNKFSMKEPIEIDQLSEEIVSLIKKYFDFLEIDFIIESLTYLGHAPNILYDDDGRFAVEVEGFQTVPQDGPSDIEMSFFVEAKKWKSTIREAVKYYLDDEE